LRVDANDVALADVVARYWLRRSAGGTLWTIRAKKFRLFSRRCGCRNLRRRAKTRGITEDYRAGLCLDIDFPAAEPDACLKWLVLYGLRAFKRGSDGPAHRPGSDVGILWNFDLEMNRHYRIDRSPYDGDRYQRAAVIDQD